MSFGQRFCRRAGVSAAAAMAVIGAACLPVAVRAQEAIRSSPGHVKPGVTFTGPGRSDVAANKPSRVVLHFAVTPGFHINSHAPREAEQIATKLAIVEPQGVKVTAADFPAGSDYAFSFEPDHKLSVYSGEFDVTLQTVVRAGEHTVPAVLHYQACDDRTCFPPRDLDLKFVLSAK